MDAYSIGFAGLVGLWLYVEVSRIQRRLANTEAMLHRLMVHLKVDSEASMEPSEAVRLLAADPKSYVAAIKAYREQTGLSLKQAKEAVDRLVPGHRAGA